MEKKVFEGKSGSLNSLSNSSNINKSLRVSTKQDSLASSFESERLQRFSKILHKYKVKQSNYYPEINEYIKNERKKISTNDQKMILSKQISRSPVRNNTKLISKPTILPKLYAKSPSPENHKLPPQRLCSDISYNISLIKDSPTNIEHPIAKKEAIRSSSKKKAGKKSKSPNAIKTTTLTNDKLKFYCSLENNGKLVKNFFFDKPNWEECFLKDNPELNFKWEAVSYKLGFKLLLQAKNNNLLLVNHFEGHNCLTNKLNLFLNLLKYCEKTDINIFSFIPFTVPFVFNSVNYNESEKSFGYLFEYINGFVVKEMSESASKSKLYSQLFQIGCKLSKIILKDKYDFLGVKTALKIPDTHYKGKNYWLVKAVNLNRGRGIKICNNVSTISKCIKKFSTGICLNFKESEEYDKDIYEEMDNHNSDGAGSDDLKKYKSFSVILQKYIEDPFLFNKRKFDIRLWVLLSHKLEVYVFR